MNLYQTFNKLFATPKGVAQITGQKGSGVVVGTDTRWGVCGAKRTSTGGRYGLL